MNANGFRARVINISERREAGICSLPRFLAQPSRGVCTQLADIFIRHAELDGHHQYIVVREVRAVVRLDVANHALLQKPLYLSAVYRIAREPVNFPANYSLRFTAPNARHHVVEYRATRNLRGFLFDELDGDL
ncbi:hypothetical protein A2763_03410 [Candidatus Kaiserbacteria bacterium RIFCSPHIGHO2_01_FULL_54_36]|uniref:Uncharacterized protein n=1 Tax=Candidatus Kaiserbacteria bacterium RIFCSPHIGHO2_01_FULL_54_36 TaxID=1798482 RepID=A0A1F6CL50_9BACT|nr:MAG: hypothetical protein A2763_03410 [Candidatus Kaiserbacteria bacterium RIFCSPHIGHO2_01_FULL_54_36]